MLNINPDKSDGVIIRGVPLSTFTPRGIGSKNRPILRTNSTGNADKGGGAGQGGVTILKILRTDLPNGSPHLARHRSLEPFLGRNLGKPITGH